MTANNNYLKKTLQLVLPLLLGIFLCWYAFAQFSTEELALIKEQFLKADYSYLWLSVAMGFLSHVSRGIRWQYTLASMHYFPKRYNLVLAVFIGYLLNLTVPRSGEVSRALLINRYDKVPFDKAFGTILTERVIDMCILLLFIAVVFVFQFDLVWHFLEGYLTFSYIIVVLLALGLLFLGGVYWIYRSTSSFAQKVRKMLSGIKEGIFSILHLKKKWQFIAHTLFIWLMYFWMFYVVFFSMEQTKELSIIQVLTAFVIGSFAIVFTNGGLGAYPLFIAKVLLLFGVTETVGTALGWVIWIAQFLMIILFGGLSFLLLPIINRRLAYNR
ncbi:lysylphosphatidylglycerol synthase transmembrane domain-containing protein [uncultured Capnocytophaga sp.]|uniref:lysylphosphatidylglycerol synthase transmembrane domain-containing protein n=1 Tax=uncultured Capnocytophaga sp. TaxID=159273 RepID=UPI0026028EDC|nr:lysylphosphatidylglycerol synthase transmembrane domain-containing protein [uncultured Capnocytophaga sp.]